MAAELATGYVTLIPSAKGFRSALDSEIGGGMDAAGGDAGDKAAKGFGTRFSSGIKSAAKIAAVGFGAAFVGAAVLGKASIDAASNLSEAQTKVNVVFGEGAQAVNDWAKTAADGFGQSQRSALEAAGTYGNLFQSFGVAQKPAQEMSQNLVELAADLASFNNTSVDDALAALQSGLSGETEPLKRYGVALSDVRLREEALRLGLIATTKDALTPGIKAQAAYALTMKDSALAQGDFARTSDGLANQQRILNAKIEDSKATLGKALLPIMTSVVAFAAKNLPLVIEHLQTFARAVQEGFSSKSVNAEGIVGVFQRVGLIAREVVEWFQRNWHTIRDVTVAVFTAVVTAVRFFIEEILPRVITGAQAVTNFFTDNWPTIQGIFVGVVNALQTAWTSVGRPVFDAIVTAVRFVSEFIATNWPGISAVVTTVFTTVQTVISTVVGAIQNIISGFTSFVQGIWDSFGANIMEQVRVVWDYVRSQIESVINIVRGIIQAVLGLIRGDWQGAWDGIKQIVDGVWTGIKSTIQAAVDTVKNVLSAAWTAVKTTASTAWEGVKTTISGAIDNIVATIKELPGKAGGALAGLGTSIGSKIKEAATTALEAAKTLVGDVVEEIKKLPGRALSALGNAAGSIASSVIGAIKNGVNAAIDQINSHRPSVSFFGVNITVPPIPRINFHEGGLVPGRPGQEVPAMLLAGEVVLSREQVAAGAGGGINVGTIVAADPDDTIRKLELLAWRQRMAGAA